MKYYSSKIILFFSISSFFLLMGIIFLNGAPANLPAKSGNKSLAERASGLSGIKLEENYKKYAANIISAFKKTKEQDKTNPAAVSQSKDELLALRVPAKYREIHLNLIISLGLMEEGLRGSKEKLVLGQQRFDSLLKENSWLVIE